MSPTQYTSTTRPLDAIAAGIVVVLCLSWGFNQVATKLAIHDIPPLMQAAIRSFVAAFLIAELADLAQEKAVSYLCLGDSVLRDNVSRSDAVPA